MPQDELVIIRRYWDTNIANLATIMLENEDIFTALTNENLAANVWHLNNAIGGVGLQVRREDAERANLLLQEVEEDSDSELSLPDVEGQDDWVDFDEDIPLELARDARSAAIFAFFMSIIVLPGALMAIFFYRKTFRKIEQSKVAAAEEELSEETMRTIETAVIFSRLLIVNWILITLLSTAYFLIQLIASPA